MSLEKQGEPLQAPEVLELGEQIAEFTHYWGFKKIHGKIWAQVYLAKEPMDASHLIQVLNISKGLASMSLNELLQYGVIKEAGKNKKGATLYAPNADLMSVIYNVVRSREKKMLSHIYAAYRSLENLSSEEKDNSGIHEERLQSLGKLIRSGEMMLETFMLLKGFNLTPWKKLKSSLSRSKAH